MTPYGSSISGARGLVSCLRNFFSIFGVPTELSSDGGPEFASSVTSSFLKTWDVVHRISSAYHPRSNGRAEVAVKTAKRLLRSNVNASGSLDNDKFLRAMLQLRNTPDPDCKLSPAEIVFGRNLRDSFAFLNRLEKFTNPSVRPTWREAWKMREDALRTRFSKTTEKLNRNSRFLPSLNIGDRCLVQNQTGNHPTKWDKSGLIVEVLPFDQYMVIVDGSRRLTRRNRKYLRKYTPSTTTIKYGYDSASTTDNLRKCDVSVDEKTTTDITHPGHDFVSDCPTTSSAEGDITCDQPTVKRPPLALRRLQDYNSSGRAEQEADPVVSRLRPRI